MPCLRTSETYTSISSQRSKKSIGRGLAVPAALEKKFLALTQMTVKIGGLRKGYAYRSECTRVGKG